MAWPKRKSKNTVSEYEMAMGHHDDYNPLGLTENAAFPDNIDVDYRPRTLVDQTLEIIDPTPNIYTLFRQFNVRFFENKLLSVAVKWSQRMTSCAGVCSFHPRSRECIISLSAPLLKLRPRKDLVETLLHEMIHGYLFLTNNNRDRDGHGPEFCKFMNWINNEAGTNITIYHTFHDEVKLYQTHWWRCDGPCQKRPPYFGMVRRAMNRAPGPSDFWWQGHQQTCGGTYIKVREPEKKTKKKNSRVTDENKKPKGQITNGKPDKNLDDWFVKSNGNSSNWPTGSSSKVPTSSPNPQNGYYQTKVPKPLPTGLTKLGTSTNNVHGWGTGGPGSSPSKQPSSSNVTPKNDRTAPRLSFVGTLGGPGTGRSNLLDKYSTSSSSNSPNSSNTRTKKNSPILAGSKTFDPSPLARTGKNSPILAGSKIFDLSPPAKRPKIEEPWLADRSTSTTRLDDTKTPQFVDCPICNIAISTNYLNDHIDVCLIAQNEDETKNKSLVIEIDDGPKKSPKRKSVVKETTPPKGQTTLDSFVKSPKRELVNCPVCDKTIVMSELYDHFDNDCSDQPTKNEKNHVEPRPEIEKKNFVDLTVDRENTNNRENIKKSYVCLVCNVAISGEIALNDHLEICVQEIFNDDSFDVGNESLIEASTSKSETQDDKFPCPVCMDLIKENLMNEHLDKCLVIQ